MRHPFCSGYGSAPWRRLVEDFPSTDAYPQTDFRTEWGPIFHRGRLNGSARVLLIGQDPAQHETIVRRVLVGEAGQRIQGFLSKLGLDQSYLFVNTFLYSVYGRGGERHVTEPGIATYRNRWLDAVRSRNQLQAVVTLGHLADLAYQAWPGSAQATWTYANVLHPTYPDSAAASGTITFADAMLRLTQSWNQALEALTSGPQAVTPDAPRPLVPYGAARLRITAFPYLPYP